jgi:MHS family proline/betaine transporter-like MFS transporter
MMKIDSKTIASILIGTVLEWYDFSLLGLMAPIISTLFFPAKTPILSLLATFGVFASGFIARPIGGILFGHFGDRHGRRAALSITIIFMALPTTLIGLLPTYQTLGIMAPITLVILRLAQGFAASGEYPGAICFLTEIALPSRKGFWGSVSVFGVTGGIFLGSMINFILTYYLTSSQMNSWGWRIPFLIGLPLGIVGWYLRCKVKESELFKAAVEKESAFKIPLCQILKFNFASLVKVIIVFALSSISFFLGFVYIATYLVSTHKITFHEVLLNNTISMLVLILLIPAFGYLSDKINRNYIMFAGACCLGIFFYPIYLLFLSGNSQYFLQGQIALAFCIAMFVGPMAAATAEMFTTLTRYSGVSVGLNVGVSVFGGTCPLVATYLVYYSGNVAMPCVYPIVVAGLSMLTIYKLNNIQSSSFNELESSSA